MEANHHRNLSDYRRVSDRNLLQEESMMPSGSPLAAPSYQSPGLSSSPDDDARDIKDNRTTNTATSAGSVKTEQISNVNKRRMMMTGTPSTAASTDTSSAAHHHQEQEELNNHHHHNMHEENDDHDHDDQFDWEQDEEGGGVEGGGMYDDSYNSQSESYDNSNSSYEPGAVGRLIQSEDPQQDEEEEIVFGNNQESWTSYDGTATDHYDNSEYDQPNTNNNRSPHYHARERENAGTDSDDPSHGSFAMEHDEINGQQQERIGVPYTVNSDEEEYDDDYYYSNNNNNHQHPAGVDDKFDEEEEEEPAGLEYDEVEYDGCTGRLILTDDDLRFYILEEVQVSLPWAYVAKRQVSPPAYAIPMLRIKTINKENYMFRLGSQEIANTMREDLKMFQGVGNTNANPPAVNNNNDNVPEDDHDHHDSDEDDDDGLPPYKQREHASLLVGGATPEEPMHQEGDYSQSSAVDVSFSATEGDQFDDEEDHQPKRNNRSDLLAKPHSTPSLGGGEDASGGAGGYVDDDDDYSDEPDVEATADGDDKEKDPVIRRGSMAASKLDAIRERDVLLKEQECKEKHERQLKSWLFYTFCCSAIIFLIIGGVSGFFIGRGTADDSSPAPPPPTEQPTDTTSKDVTTIPTPPPAINTSESTTSQPTPLRGTPSPNWDPSTSTATNAGETIVPTVATSEETITVTPTASDAAIQPSLRPTVQPSSISATATTGAPTLDNAEITEAPSQSSDTTNPPTLAPNADSTQDSTQTWPPTIYTPVLDSIRSASSDGGTALDTAGSPQQRAYRWMANQDELSADLPEPKQLQRYSLATFFYATGGPEVWNAAPKRRQGSSTSWLDPSTDDCDWDFVVCDQDTGAIEALDISPPNGPALVGTLPPQIGLFSMLRSLVIDSGNPEASTAARLEALTGDEQNRSVELIGGTLPSEVGELTSLETLMITHQALNGSLPKEVGNMTSIKTFDLTHNVFSNFIPWQLGIPQIEQLRLGYNVFQAKIKTRMFQQENGITQSLSGLFLNDNQLIGDLPTHLGLLTNLETALHLGNNRLRGTLPTELAQLTKMKVFRVDGTTVTGTIPPDFRQWNSIQEIQLQDTGLTGEMPLSMCRLFRQANTETYANCEYLECSCCTYCCASGECEKT